VSIDQLIDCFIWLS